MKSPTLAFPAAAFVVAAICALVYGDAGSAGFINWDDDVYVYENPVVAAGLSMDGWKMAWSFDTPPYYMPITWLSFLVNAELSGIDAGAFHLVNVMLHTASSLLLLFVLRFATADLPRSLLAAALFAAHPLHVEGVMWVAQRKEMLSASFGLLALLAYCIYARRASNTAGGNPPRAWYLATLLALLMSLLAKPMWLTAPALLLLLDAWPLQRLHIGVKKLLAEKIPVLMICLAVLAVNVTAFKWDAAQLVESMDVRPFSAGWGTIPVSYVMFLWKSFIPYPLAVPYTNFQEPLSPAVVAGSIGVLAVVTVLAVRSWHRAPWILVGWLWFLISAATVLFSFGSGKVTPLADHWTYVPHIGLFIAIAWSLPLGPRSGRVARLTTAAGCLAAVAVLGAMAHAQTRHWQDPPALWSHSIAVTEGNHTAHWLWGIYEWEAGHHETGERLMREARRLNPEEAFYVQRFARLLLEAGRKSDALAELRRLLEPELAAPAPLATAGITALRVFGPAEAERYLRRAVALAGSSETDTLDAARVYLWIALSAQDRPADAQVVLERILAAREVDSGKFCQEARTTIRHLAGLDAGWRRYVPDIDAACAAAGPEPVSGT